MKTARFQRGQLLVAALVLIAVVGLMIVTLGYLSVSTQSSSILHSQSDQAYSAAKSGVEFSARQYFTGTGCTSLNNANVQVGNAGATFTLTPTLFAPLTLTGTSAAVVATSASIPVTSTTGYAARGRILVDSELINYTSTTATTFGGLARGAGGTTAAAHASGATVSQNVCVIASRGDTGNARRNLVGVLGAGDITSPGALGTMGHDAMMVYGKAAGDRNVYYRLWDPTTNDWSVTEQTAQPVSVGSNPLFFTVQFARTRNEAIMGVLDGNSNIYIQVWNGRTWTIPANGGPLGTADVNTHRPFHIAYEYTSDIARIVYQNDSNGANPQYATWNGTTLTRNGNILGTYPVGGGGTRHQWFKLAPRNVTGSNDILMMSLDDARDVYGLRWTGAAWNNMGVATRWDTSVTNTNLREAIDVAWQADGAAALFVFGDGTTQQIGRRTWNATTSTLSAQTNAVLTGGANVIYEWLRLYPDPSNNILLLIQTANNGTRATLQSTLWNGAAFGAVTTHDTNTLESSAARNFDFTWEKVPGSSGKGWLLWGSSGSNGIRTRYFTSPATWGAASTIQDHTLLVQAATLSPSGRFVAGAYQAAASATDDIDSLTTTGAGAAWANTSTTLWGGPTGLQTGERIFVATREGQRINTGASGTGVVSVLQWVEP